MALHPTALRTRPSSPDLRRRRLREEVERLVERAARLDSEDRRLITAVFAEGVPAAQLARERDADARWIRRRVRAIARRVLDPRFEFVARHAESWRPTRRRVATALYIRGRTLRQTARELGLSLYLVRLNRDAVEAMFEAEDALRARLGAERG
ncbi:MAG: hypothetical protein ACTS22_09765 [Phycisphaerales bacterium]